MSVKATTRDCVQLDLLSQELLTPTVSPQLRPAAQTDAQRELQDQRKEPHEVLYISRSVTARAESCVVRAGILGLEMLSDEAAFDTTVLQLSVQPVFLQVREGNQKLLNRERLRIPVRIHPLQAVRARLFVVEDHCTALELRMVEYLLVKHDTTQFHPARGRTSTKQVVSERDQLIAAAHQQTGLTHSERELIALILEPLKADTVQRILQKSRRRDFDVDAMPAANE